MQESDRDIGHSTASNEAVNPVYATIDPIGADHVDLQVAKASNS